MEFIQASNRCNFAYIPGVPEIFSEWEELLLLNRETWQLLRKVSERPTYQVKEPLFGKRNWIKDRLWNTKVGVFVSLWRFGGVFWGFFGGAGGLVFCRVFCWLDVGVVFFFHWLGFFRSHATPSLANKRQITNDKKEGRTAQDGGKTNKQTNKQPHQTTADYKEFPE